MNLKELFLGKSLSFKKLNSMFNRANQLNQTLNRLNKKIDSYYHYGTDVLSTDTDNPLVMNNKGNPVYGTPEDLGLLSRHSDKVYKRSIVNLLKNYIDTIVASHSEVNPLPQAVGKSNYNYPEKTKHKINLVLENLFTEENNFKQIYQIIVREAYLYRYAVVGLNIDTYNAKTTTPIKFKVLNQSSLLIDPTADSIDTAEYVIHKQKTTWNKFLKKYQYKPKEGEEHSDDEEVDILCYWIKFQPDNQTFGSKWIKIYTLKDKQERLFLKTKTGRTITQNSEYVEDILPFVVFRTEITNKWYGDISKGEQALPLQEQYNDAVTQNNYNWEMFVNPPFTGNIDSTKLKEATKPGGLLTLDETENVEPMKQMLADPNAVVTREETIKKNYGIIFGNTDLAEGRRPTGVYANKMLETLISLNKIKPKMIENILLKSVSDLADKALKILAEWMGTRSISIFDYDKGQNTDISVPDIINSFFSIDVKIADANLLTPQAKLNNLTQFMQYGKLQEKIHPYFIAMIANNAMSDFFPEKVMQELKKDYESSITAAASPTAPPISSTGQVSSLTSNPASVDDELNQIRAQLQQSGEWDAMNKLANTNDFISDIQQQMQGLDPSNIVPAVEQTISKFRDIMNTNRRI